MLAQPSLHLTDFALLVLQDEVGGFLQLLVAARLELAAGQGDGVLVVRDEQGRVVAVGAARAGVFGRSFEVAVRRRLVLLCLGHDAVGSGMQASGGGFELLLQLVGLGGVLRKGGRLGLNALDSRVEVP